MGYIRVSEEIDAYELKERLWSGAEDTMQRIIDEGKEDTFFAILSDLHCDKDSIDLTEINDLLRFEQEQVFEWCGISDEEDEDREYCITDEEFETLKNNKILSEAHIQVIQESFDIGVHTVIHSEFTDVEELTEAEQEELNEVVGW